MSAPTLTASYVTLTGAGFARIGIHLNDFETLGVTDVADILSGNDLELGESGSSPVGPRPGTIGHGVDIAAQVSADAAREVIASATTYRV
jgi:hypothetical protein